MQTAERFQAAMAVSIFEWGGVKSNSRPALDGQEQSARFLHTDTFKKALLRPF